MSKHYRNYRTSSFVRVMKKILRDYFSGVPISFISKRYGFSESKIYSLANDFRTGKIDIFDTRTTNDLYSVMGKMDKSVSDLERELEESKKALMKANLKIEGYEIMNSILRDEYGIDLSKKLEAKRLQSSKRGTKK